MQIDWITVGAQIVNFLVLVWLLNALLYRPVTRAMETREAAIRDRFAEAERREAEAGAEAERTRAERAAIEDQRAALLAEAEEEAHSFSLRLEHEARGEVDARRAAWEDELRKEQAAFLRELRHNVAGHVSRVARRVLSDLAGAELESAVTGVFVARLRGLEGKALKDLRAEAGDARGLMSVDSAFELGAADRTRIEEAAREVLHPEAGVAFRTDPDLVCGLRLRVGGQTVQWNVDDYLDALEAEVAPLLSAAGDGEAAERP